MGEGSGVGGALRAALIACTAALGLAAVAPAWAERPVRSWPGGTVRYHEALPKAYDASFDQAVRAWNTSGVRVRFIRVKRASQADLRVSLVPTLPYGADGIASVGMTRNAYLNIRSVRWKTGHELERQRLELRQVATHELGHVLGLGHVNKCATMHPNGPIECPPPAGNWQYFCRLLYPDDVRRAAKRYGGKPRPVAPLFCDWEPAPPPLLNVRFSGGESERARVRVDWERPVGLPTDAHLYLDRYPPGRCGTETERVRREELDPRATSWSDTDAASYPGRYCFSLQAMSRLGHPAKPFTAELTSFAGPDPPTISNIVATGENVVQVTASLGSHDGDGRLAAHYGPAGSCPTTHPGFAAPLSVYARSESLFEMYGLPAGAWCISFFTSSGGVMSKAVMREFVMPAFRFARVRA